MKKKWLLFILLIVIKNISSAQMQIECQEAEYRGSELILTGKAKIDHSLATIEGDCLTLYTDEKKSSAIEPKKIIVKEKVFLNFHEKGNVKCHQALLDFDQLQAFCWGKKDRADLLFTWHGWQKEAVLKISAAQLQLNLEKSVKSGDKQIHLLLRSVEAADQVKAQYNDQFTIIADHAFYAAANAEEFSSLKGKLVITAKDGFFCQLFTEQKEEITAKKIIIDLATQTIYGEKVKGHFCTDFPLLTQQVHFQAERLSWKLSSKELTLWEKVVVSQEQLQISTKENLILNYKLTGKRKQLDSIVAPNGAQIAYQGALEQQSYQITSPGKYYLDYGQDILYVQSLPEIEKENLEYEPIVIKTWQGEMQARSMVIKGSKQEKQRLLPYLVILKDQVQFAGYIGKQLLKNVYCQYALADELTYFPLENKLYLKGKEKKRVLFWDQNQGIKMSAPALDLCYDKRTQKESIKGKGNVRFTFTEKENGYLSQKFHFNLSHVPKEVL